MASHAPTHYNLEVADAATLAAETAAFDTGDTAYVVALGYSFTYNAASAATVDNTTVINGPAGVGRWLQTPPAGNTVVFRPAGTVAAGVVTTWAQLMAAVAASPIPLRILVDFTGAASPVVTPAGTFDLKYSSLEGLPGTAGFLSILRVSDGTTLKNIGPISGYLGLDLQNNTIGAQSLVWDHFTGPAKVADLVVKDSARLSTSGTQPAIISDSTVYDALLCSFYNQANIVIGAAGELVHVLNGASVSFEFESTSVLVYASTGKIATAQGATSQCSLALRTATSPGLDTPSVSLPGFTLSQITYSNIIAGALLTTADRNAVVISKEVGSWYYDTTVSKPVYWNGAAWADAVGTLVP